MSCPLAAWRGAESPIFGTMIRSIDDGAGLALLDRIERARPAQRKTRLALRESDRVLARHHLRDLARLEVRDLDLPPQHVDAGRGGVHRDAELGSLDHGGEIRGLDFEMLDVPASPPPAGASRPAAGSSSPARPSSRSGRPITEFGETRMVSSPRTKSTRPLRPVRTVSPGFKTSSCASDACWAPDVVIETSPDDFPTRQTPSSAASALASRPQHEGPSSGCGKTYRPNP